MINRTFGPLPRVAFLTVFIISGWLFSACDDGPKKKRVKVPFSPIVEEQDRNLDTDSELRFDILSAGKTGIDFNNELTFSNKFWGYTNIYNGGGVAVEDLNNDGKPDIYLCKNSGADAVFLNKGDLTFDNISESSGLGEDDGSWSTGVVMVDINNDGFKDIYVCKSANVDDPNLRKNKFFINQNGTSFVDQAVQMNVADTGFTTHCSFFDYDNDGDLDLYVLNHPIDFNDRPKFNNHEKIETGRNMSDQLYRNNGDMTFTNVSKESGINNHGFGLSVSTCDLDGDGWTDIFVTNDWGMLDHYYVNQGDGTFKDEALEKFSKQSFSSMGSDINDFNNDGHWDIFVTEMESKDQATHKAFAHEGSSLSKYRQLFLGNYHHQFYRNALHINTGDGTFVEAARASNIASSEWSWGTLFVDMDDDGWKDLFIANGYLGRFEKDKRSVIQKLKSKYRRGQFENLDKALKKAGSIEFVSTNKFYRNNQELAFIDSTNSWGGNYGTISHGAAYADFDQDGDLDIITNNMNSDAFIYRNNSEKFRSEANYLNLKLVGEAPNIDAIGSRVELISNGNKQVQHVTSSRGYQSSSEFLLHFGIGKAQSIDLVTVFWPNGKSEQFKDLRPNQLLNIKMGSGNATPIETRLDQPVFAQINEVGIQHKEDDYDDFHRNQLKPRFHSTLGPSIALGDINGDGVDEVYIAGAKGQKGAFWNTNNDQTVQADLNVNAELEELGALLFDVDNDGDNDLYLAIGDCGLKDGHEDLQDLLFINDGAGNFTQENSHLPEMKTITSVVTAADYDQDGDLDLFVGGRYRKGEYPSAPRSYLLQNDNGKFTDVTDQKAQDLSNTGMVTSALWSDCNNDGLVDLILVGEWMNIQIWKNNGKKLVNKSERLDLQNTGGWWNSIVGGDFDGDGDTDYILGNQGVNLRYRPGKDQPIQIYHGQFDGDESRDFMLSYYYEGKEYPIHHLDDLAKEFKFIGDKFKSYNVYSKSTMDKVLGENNVAKSEVLKADLFHHVYLENQIDTFILHKLPVTTQLSCIQGMVVDDFNNDQNLDVLIHGNLFDWLPQYEKQDGMKGILLLGSGDGRFAVKNPISSGFYSPNEGRALIRTCGEAACQIIAGQNDDLTLHYNYAGNKKSFRYQPTEYRADVVSKSGAVQKHECYYGEGYLSQSDRLVRIDPESVSKIIFYDYDGNSRETIIDN